MVVSGSILLDWGLIGLVLAVAIVYVRSYTRLSHIPGPRLWGLSVFPLFQIHLNGGIYEKFGHLHQQYGPLVRVGPNTLLTADPDVLRRMSAVRSPYTRSDWYVALRMNPGQDNVLSVRSEARHDELRRKMGFGYSGKENLTLEQDIDDCVKEMVHLINTKYISGPGKIIPMDLARKIQFFTSDVMSKLSFNSKFHDLRDDNDNLGYIHEIETVIPNIFCTCCIPQIIDFLTDIGFLGLIGPSTNSKLGLGKVLAITRDQVAKRFGPDGKATGELKDMLGSFIRHGLTQKEAESESVFQLAAGSDTTASGLRATLLGILSSPLVYQKLIKEIDEGVAAGKIPSDDLIISDAQARELPYLQACIKEGDTISGHFVPGGVSIAYSAKQVHHSPALFGPDEYAYRPDRWILHSDGGDEASAEKIKAMEQNNELIFGYGKYQCLGKPVAMIELNKVILELFRRFEFTLMNPFNPWKTRCFGIHFQTDMWVTVHRRTLHATGVE
ncbi:hypothetical protein DV737_g3781, partial [Chaetothyriales sp. CBS 132003]